MGCIVAHSRPTDFVTALVGTGAAIVTDTAALFNGRPAHATRIRWLSNPAPTTADYIELQFTRATPFPPGLIGLFGFDVYGFDDASGFKTTWAAKRSGDAGFTYSLGGNAALQRVVELEDNGSLRAIVKPEAGLDDIIGIALRIYNDQNGVATLDADSFVDLGEVWASEAVDVAIKKGWEFQYPDDKVPTSLNDQPWATPFPPGRKLPLTRDLMRGNDAFVAGGSTPTAQKLRWLIGGGRVSVQVPRWLDAAGELDVDWLHQSAMFCTSQFNKLSHMTGDRFAASWTNTEIPALLAT